METLNASNVRKDFSRFIDTVVREKPLTIKRNRDFVVSLSLEHLKNLLTDYRLHVTYLKEDDGTITGSLDEIDIVVNGNNHAELQRLLAEALVEYAQEYNHEFNLYYHSLNRKSHFPYVLQVLIQNDIDEVIQLLNA